MNEDDERISQKYQIRRKGGSACHSARGVLLTDSVRMSHNSQKDDQFKFVNMNETPNMCVLNCYASDQEMITETVNQRIDYTFHSYNQCVVGKAERRHAGMQPLLQT